MTERYAGRDEFMTIREIRNDLLHRLHDKDIKLISNITLHSLQYEQPEFRSFIRTFYLLDFPTNPLRSTRSADNIIEEILSELYQAVKYVRN